MNPVLAIHEATKGAEKQRRFYEPELTFSAFVPSSRFFVFTSFPIATPGALREPQVRTCLLDRPRRLPQLPLIG
jgi:hypothetical protein